MKRIVLAMVVVCGAIIAIYEAPYLNWRCCAPPVDAQPLVIRQDAKGDGRFLASRSGHRRHRGLDLVADLNSPVHAIHSGRVVKTGYHHGFGRFVDIEHQPGLHSVYAHLASIEVRPGTRVRQGEAIGTVGKTGNARSRLVTPHLHLEIVKDGDSVDPRSLGLQAVEPPPAPDVAHAAGGE